MSYYFLSARPSVCQADFFNKKAVEPIYVKNEKDFFSKTASYFEPKWRTLILFAF